MPIHPARISCDHTDCEGQGTVSHEGLAPLGWVISSHVERRMIPYEDPAAALGEDVPPEAAAMLAQMMPTGPESASFVTQTCLCPKHADLPSARLYADDREQWVEMGEE